MTMSSRGIGTGPTPPERRGDRTFRDGAAGEAALHARLGTDLYRRRLYARAVQEFRWALDAEPGSADIHNQLSIALNAQGRYEEAVSELRQALAIDPAYAEAAVNLARTLQALGSDETPPVLHPESVLFN